MITESGLFLHNTRRQASTQKRLARRLRALHRDQRGAITASGLFVATWMNVLDATQLAINLDLDTHRIALFTNTITPNFSTDTAYAVAPYNANETSGGSWAAGGPQITGTALSESPTGTIMLDATDISVGTTTITNARGGLVYADALGDEALFLFNFGADFSTSNGTFAITWAATGLMTWDLTP